MSAHLLRHADHVLADGTFRVGMTKSRRVIVVIDVTESALGPLHLLFEVGPPEPTLIKTGGVFGDILQAVTEEAHAILEPRAEREIAQTRTDIAEAEKSLQAPSDYNLKKAARVARMEQRAAKLRAASDAAATRSKSISDRIPMGQPILVGHHSERRHRRDLEKIRKATSDSVKLAQKAKQLEQRAARADANGAISSDDPKALSKLRAKLVELEADRARMQKANEAIRAGGDVAGKLRGLGIDEKTTKRLLEPDPMKRVGFAPYTFKNLASNTKRIKERIEELERRATTPPPAPERIGNVTIAEEDNRVRVSFPDTPPDVTRRALKGSGFKWAPSVHAWQRQANAGAWAAARRIVSEHAKQT